MGTPLVPRAREEAEPREAAGLPDRRHRLPRHGGARAAARARRPRGARLVRARRRRRRQERLDGVLAKLWRDPSPYRERVRAVAGDADRARPRASSPRDRAPRSPRRPARCMHCAASISFDLPLEEARAINVEGTREVIGFAREAKALGRLERFVHVSTAYVAGDHRGHVPRAPARRRPGRSATPTSRPSGRPSTSSPTPTDLAPGDRAAEHRHGRVRLRLDAGVQRPLLAAARVLARAVRRGPGAARRRCVDVVPVDYVADALVHLLDTHGAAGVFNLVAGRDACTVDELVAPDRRGASARSARRSSRRARRAPARARRRPGRGLLPVLRHGDGVRRRARAARCCARPGSAARTWRTTSRT